MGPLKNIRLLKAFIKYILADGMKGLLTERVHVFWWVSEHMKDNYMWGFWLKSGGENQNVYVCCKAKRKKLHVYHMWVQSSMMFQQSDERAALMLINFRKNY